LNEEPSHFLSFVVILLAVNLHFKNAKLRKKVTEGKKIGKIKSRILEIHI